MWNNRSLFFIMPVYINWTPTLDVVRWFTYLICIQNIVPTSVLYLLYGRVVFCTTEKNNIFYLKNILSDNITCQCMLIYNLWIVIPWVAICFSIFSMTAGFRWLNWKFPDGDGDDVLLSCLIWLYVVVIRFLWFRFL